MSNFVLIAEDEPMLRKVLSMEIEMSGYKVVTACNAKEAIEQLKNNPIRLIISDIRMPGGDGFELLAHVLELNKTNSDKIIIHLMSGHADISKEEVIERGASGMLPKPFSFSAIEEILNNTSGLK